LWPEQGVFKKDVSSSLINQILSGMTKVLSLYNLDYENVA
jgi:hypothetical protein